LGEFLGKYLEEHPKSAKAIVQKGVLAAEARTACSESKSTPA
jgi:DNA gyrase subunit B